MKDKDQIREEHRRLLRQLSQESGMHTTAIAKDIGVAPSTLNRVVDDNEQITHVLSTPTLYKLQEFRARTRSARAAKAIRICAKVGTNPVQEGVDPRLLFIWGELSDDAKLVLLEFLEGITRLLAGKAS